MSNYYSNHFVKFSYQKINMGYANYRIVISDGVKTITAPTLNASGPVTNLERTWYDNLKNFMYYVDNGAVAYDRMVQSNIIEQLAKVNGLSKSSLGLQIFNTLSSSDNTPDKVISILKSIASTPLIIDPFLIGDFVIVAVNKDNCQYTIDKIAQLPVFHGDPNFPA
ncbi:hypothetical protein [Fusibacter sp. 3D3]|uniref:hypothetical protein n=1 Tax=Fusibacter sp. 3D3 TaxID=1048380 RepID=UPI000852CAB0|nr:hypothetical protein [Fusibacter sp. 3D3]GAU77874.1 hypothetical protein F3D3_2503 [Fusibacter sp. 3D3]